MNKTAKTVLIVLSIWFAVLAGCVATIAAVVYHHGIISVNVHERGPHGAWVYIPVPAFLVNPIITIAGTQADHCEGYDHDFDQIRPAVRAALMEANRYRDFTMLEVNGRDGEHVTIGKKNGRLEVHVDAPDANVHIVVPESTMKAVAGAI